MRETSKELQGNAINGEINPTAVRGSLFQYSADGETMRLENDFVLAMTGYPPDVEFLQSMGIEIDPASKRPKYDPGTLETNVPGIFVAGVITAGNVSGEVFIENSRQHGDQIVRAIRRRMREQPVERS